MQRFSGPTETSECLAARQAARGPFRVGALGQEHRGRGRLGGSSVSVWPKGCFPGSSAWNRQVDAFEEDKG